MEEIKQDFYLFNKISKEDSLITDFSQIEKDFLEIYYQITNQKFNNKIIILPDSEIYKYTHGRTAAMHRPIFFGKNKIWIREMPIHQIFYELSHEIGHTVKPHLENISLDIEETKAVLFQYCFSQKIKNSSILWRKEFVEFEKFRINHIQRKDLKYAEYHKTAEWIAKENNYDYNASIRFLLENIKR